MRYRLTHQQLGLGPRARHAHDRDESDFPGRSIGANGLSGLRRGTFDIEQIVGDLERKPEIVRIAAQCQSRLGGRLCENRPGFAREGDQRAGLHAL